MLTPYEESEIRLALQDRITYLLKMGLLDSACKCYSAYLKVGGYHAGFLQGELEQIQGGVR